MLFLSSRVGERCESWCLVANRRDRRTFFEDRRDRCTDEALLDDYFIAASEKKSMFFCCALVFLYLCGKIIFTE